MVDECCGKGLCGGKECGCTDSSYKGPVEDENYQEKQDKIKQEGVVNPRFNRTADTPRAFRMVR